MIVNSGLEVIFEENGKSKRSLTEMFFVVLPSTEGEKALRILERGESSHQLATTKVLKSLQLSYKQPVLESSKDQRIDWKDNSAHRA